MITTADILKASILIVDDQVAHSSLLEQILTGAGYVSVTTTNNPHEVCDLYRKNHYSLILLDLQMPGMDGFQVMEELKTIETGGYPPVLVLTAQPDQKLRALKAGARDFLSKPFDLAEVLMRVHNMLEVRLLHQKAEWRAQLAEQREKAISASELSYRRLFEAAQDGILILEVETGRITDVNPFLCKLLGFSPKDMIGKTVGELSPFSDIESNQIMLERLQEDGYVRYEDLPLKTRDGCLIAVEFVSNVYLAGKKDVIQCNVRDITARKNSEQQLNLLSTCVSHLNDSVIITEAGPLDEPGPKIVFVNKALEKITGYTAAEMVGRSPRFLQGEKTDPVVRNEIRQSLRQGKAIRRQVVNYKKNGGAYWMDIDIVPIFDKAGHQTHFAAIERDVTEERAIQEQLLWKTAFFEAQVNSALDGIIIVDNEGKLVLQNRKMIDLWKPPQEIFDELDHRTRMKWVATQVTNQQEFSEKVAYLYAHPNEISRDELKLINGKYFDRYTAPVIGMDGRYFGRIWTYHDITDQKRSESRFRRLVDSNAQCVFFYQRNGAIKEANDAFLKLVGFSREDMKAGLINWMAMTPPEYADHEAAVLETLDTTGVCGSYEKEFIRKDGSRVPILLGAASFEDNPEEGVVFVLDLTERRKLELQFLRAQRMESVGTLAGGIAHDLNNILAPIMMSIDILQTLTDNPQARTILKTIEVSAKRGADIVRQVLSFARGLEGQRIEVLPRHLLDDLGNIIKDTFPKDIRLQFSVSNDTWPIIGDPTQIHQVLLNLCVNARDAMPHGGILTINVENSVLDKQYAAMNLQAKAGRYVAISVTDSGTGMPPAIVDKIFEPFFTTKDVNKGTGLGLSTVMAIVKSHEGIINVYSEPGKGTTFKVYLPAMDLSAEARREQLEDVSLPRGNGETVLLVDDETSILIITGQTLQTFGYRVLKAADGAEAVAVYAQHSKEIAVVLTDMAMPIMDGAATIRALTKINPAIKIIAASGLSTNGSTTTISEANVKHFLAKPYTAGTLLKTMRAILDEVDSTI